MGWWYEEGYADYMDGYEYSPPWSLGAREAYDRGWDDAYDDDHYPLYFGRY